LRLVPDELTVERVSEKIAGLDAEEVGAVREYREPRDAP
jgi:hypothetical protein